MIAAVALPGALAFIMFAMGLTLRPDDFRAVVMQPKAMLVGLLCKLAMVPALAFALVAIWMPPASFAVGLIILAACPAGVTSSLLTHLGGGRAALAASVTAVTSVLAVVWVPLLVNIGLVRFAGYHQGIDLPVGRMAFGILLVDTVPLAIGLALHHFRPALAGRINRFARPFATFLFMMIVAGAFVSQGHTLIDQAGPALALVTALNLGTLALAWAGAAAARLERGAAIAVVLESGLQNSALGIFVASALLHDDAMMLPSVLYALVMNVSALAVIAGLRSRASRRAALTPG